MSSELPSAQDMRARTELAIRQAKSAFVSNLREHLITSIIDTANQRKSVLQYNYTLSEKEAMESVLIPEICAAGYHVATLTGESLAKATRQGKLSARISWESEKTDGTG